MPATTGNGQLVKKSDAIGNVRGLLDKMKPSFAAALPSQIKPDRFMRIAMTEIQRNPKLLDCTRQSLLGALMESAQLGLEPGLLGYAYLVPYGKTCTLIPGYRGLVDLARRSGQISTLTAEVVCEHDAFDYELGADATLKHKPCLDGERGAVKAAYACVRFKDGGVQFVVMSKDEVDRIRSRSKAGKSGPWVTDYNEMAKKTAIRRLCKLLPMTQERQLERAVELDTQAEVGLPQDLVTVEVEGVTVDEETGEVQEAPEVQGTLDRLVTDASGATDVA